MASMLDETAAPIWTSDDVQQRHSQPPQQQQQQQEQEQEQEQEHEEDEKEKESEKDHRQHDQILIQSRDVEQEAPVLPPLLPGHKSELQEHDDDSMRKLSTIHKACAEKDILALRALAISEAGFVNDVARRAAWPIVLGCETIRPVQRESWQQLKKHRDEEQVALDVNRSFVYYPRDESDKRIDQRKEELSNAITEVLRRHSYLCYFQGYHDIVQVLLLVLGATAAVPAVERLSILRIRDFMLPTMTGALQHLGLLPAILYAADHELYTHLSHTVPFYFALSGTLTLYAHEIQEYGDIARLFDLLLAHESIISIYFYTVIICSKKKELLELDPHDHDMLHVILSKLPSPLNLDHLIASAAKLYESHPPQQLKSAAWYGISSSSVLKTTHNLARLMQQTLDDGEAYFHKQAKQIQRQEDRQRQLQQARRLMLRYRRPVLLTGTAVFVAVLAFHLRKPANIFSAIADWVYHRLLALHQIWSKA